MNLGARPLVPGVALLSAGVLALGPVLAPPAPGPAQPVLPVVHVADIALAGIGQDIYDAITPYVQYAVGGVSYLINFIPLVGGPTAAQININYFQGIQPVVQATVDYLAAVVADPRNVIAETGAYGNALYGIGYNWVSAELRFLGFPELPPLAAASVKAPVREAAPVRVAAAQRAAVVDVIETPSPEPIPVRQAAEAATDAVTPGARPRGRAHVARSAPGVAEKAETSERAESGGERPAPRAARARA